MAISPWRRPRAGARDTLVAVRPVRIDMTSGSDGLTHTIADSEFDKGIWKGDGRYRAVCGADILAEALAASPGPDCPDCHHEIHQQEQRPPRRLERLLPRPSRQPQDNSPGQPAGARG